MQTLGYGSDFPSKRPGLIPRFLKKPWRKRLAVYAELDPEVDYNPYWLTSTANGRSCQTVGSRLERFRVLNPGDDEAVINQ